MRAAAGALCVLLLAGCQSDPVRRSARSGPAQYRLQVDRCHVSDRAQLEGDLQALASRRCPAGVGSLENIQPQPSRQGSLFGECLRRGALQAEVRCLP